MNDLEFIKNKDILLDYLRTLENLVGELEKELNAIHQIKYKDLKSGFDPMVDEYEIITIPEQNIRVSKKRIDEAKKIIDKWVNK